MGSAEVMRPPPENVLRVYYLTSADHATSDIALNRIKAYRFQELNDPFELLALNYRESGLGRQLNDFKAEYDRTRALLCFSRNWTDPVLWSHYGAKHRGICLGFDLARSTDLYEVEYHDQRVASEVQDKKDRSRLPEDLKRQLLRTKFKNWQYEEEVRVIVGLEELQREGSRHFYAFNSKLKLREVILGALCDHSLDNLRRLTELLQPGAVVYKARLAFKSFNVVPNKRTLPTGWDTTVG